MTHARRLDLGRRTGNIVAEPKKGGWILVTIRMPTGEAIEMQLNKEQALDANDRLLAAYLASIEMAGEPANEPATSEPPAAA